jgi:hypothetical protein
MAVVCVLARDWTIEANAGAGLKEVKGLDTLTFSDDDTKADLTKFEDEGNEAHLVAARGMTIRLAGKFLEDLSSGARDEGQNAIETLAAVIGYGSVAAFRLTRPSGKYAEFAGTVKMGDIGGGNNDPTSWNCEITRTGAMGSWT